MPTVTISEGTAIGGTVFAGVEDSGLRSGNPTTNYSTAALQEIVFWETGDETRAYIRFPGLSNVAGPVVVSNARLGYYFTQSNGPHPVYVHQLIVPVTVGQMTWNERATGVAWASGAYTSASVNMTPVATSGSVPALEFTEFSGAALDTLVQDWIGGSQDNNGLLLLRTVNNFQISEVATSNSATSALRPYLTFDWVAAGPPPNWTISSPTVDSDAGTVTLVVTLDAPAPVGGVDGLVSTYDITAVAGVDYVAQVAEPFSIAEGDTTGDIVITLIA